jgi:hypothetical protein
MSSDLNVQLLWQWANERHAIYIRKWIREGGFENPGDPWPYAPKDADLEECDPNRFVDEDRFGPLTLSKILQQYRFCNVFRELDRVTVWIDQNIRKPFANHPDLWLMLAIARTINWPDTLQRLIQASNSDELPCWPSHPDFTPDYLSQALNAISEQGVKIYTGAYMIRAESDKTKPWYSWSKQSYIAKIVIGRLWEDRHHWRNMFHDQLEMQTIWRMLQDKHYIGWGPFMAYQVVVDLRHTRYLRNAPDINTWAALGPGSRRGLNRLAGRPLDFNLSQEQGLHEMRYIWETQDRYRAPWVPKIELSDIQNCLCETDKYLRVLNEEGRPRAKYVPGRGY